MKPECRVCEWIGRFCIPVNLSVTTQSATGWTQKLSLVDDEVCRQSPQQGSATDALARSSAEYFWITDSRFRLQFRTPTFWIWENAIRPATHTDFGRRMYTILLIRFLKLQRIWVREYPVRRPQAVWVGMSCRNVSFVCAGIRAVRRDEAARSGSVTMLQPLIYVITRVQLVTSRWPSPAC